MPSVSVPPVCPSCGADRFRERHSTRCGWTRKWEDDRRLLLEQVRKDKE